MPDRFRDPLKTIESFGSCFLVVCPVCSCCAYVLGGGVEGQDVRFICPSCGRSEHWQGNRNVSYYRWGGNAPPDGVLCIGAPIDWYFHYPVWLTISCCGETLWAYNEAHLDYLEGYVSATLRERATPRAETQPRNRSLASRLPAWIKSSRNRDRILAALTKLRERLPHEHQNAQSRHAR